MRAPLLILLAIFTWSTHALAGMVVTPTRLVYTQGVTSQTITVKNSGPKAFLASASMEGEGQNYFAVTPPLFRLEPGEKALLRVRRTGSERVSDSREQLFNYSITVISSSTQPEPEANRIAVASKYWFRLFYRPSAIGKPEPNKCDLKFKLNRDGLTAVNDSEFYSTLIHLALDGEIIRLSPEQAIIAPQSSRLISRKNNITRVDWARINDFGGADTQCAFTTVDKK